MSGTSRRTTASQPCYEQPTDDGRRRRSSPPSASHGVLLARLPRQEEVDKLLPTLRERAGRRRRSSPTGTICCSTRRVRSIRSIALRPPGRRLRAADFAERVFTAIEPRRDELWRERTKTLNWELFDYGKVMHQRPAPRRPAPHGARHAAGRRANRTRRACALPRRVAPAGSASRCFLWQKTKDDIVKEMDSELQMPGWGNVWTQPIINRVNMLATGVRTQIGVKVFGPTGKPLPEAIADIQRVSERDRRAAADRARGGGRDAGSGDRQAVRRDRPSTARRPARYGVNVADISAGHRDRDGRRTGHDHGRRPAAVRRSVALRRATTGRTSTRSGMCWSPAAPRRRPARPEARYEARQAAWAAERRHAGCRRRCRGRPRERHRCRPPSSAASGGMVQIPLRMVADIRVVEGPSMIKSENGRLRNYVTLNVREPRHRRVRRRGPAGDQAHRSRAGRHRDDRRVDRRVREPGAGAADAGASSSRWSSC